MSSAGSGNENGNKTGNMSKEQRILRMVKKVLTDIAKDTVTPPGLKHPLSEQTIYGIRECLELITARESELLKEAGQSNTQKPYFIDEPQKNVNVSITPITKNKDKNNNGDK